MRSSHVFVDAPPPLAISTLSLHDALPILRSPPRLFGPTLRVVIPVNEQPARLFIYWRSEEHTSELQSLRHLVCRLLLEKKKPTKEHNPSTTITDTNVHDAAIVLLTHERKP